VKWCNARSEKEGFMPVYVVRGKVYWKGREDKIAMKAGANGYRLPSDGEWEWAARGGVKTQGYDYSGSKDLGEAGWYQENAGGKRHEVGTKKANELGIYDLSGNMWEWCFDARVELIGEDEEDFGTYRVIRGGSWYSLASYARVSYRSISAHTTLEKNCEIFRVSLLLAWTWFFLSKTPSAETLKHLFRSHFSALLSDPMALS